VLSGALSMSDSGGVFATLTPDLPFFMDLAVTNPSQGFVFPFSLITYTATLPNPPILADKTVEQAGCADGLADVGLLRSIGDCVNIDFVRASPFFIAFGDWIGASAPTSGTRMNCSYYKDQAAILFSFYSTLQTKVTFCPGLQVPPGFYTGSAEGLCYLESAQRLFTQSAPTKLTICKTACGISADIFSASCNPKFSIPFNLEGDFQVDAVTGNNQLCSFYTVSADGAFRSTCFVSPDQLTSSPTRFPTVKPTTPLPTKKGDTKYPTHKPTKRPTKQPTFKPTTPRPTKKPTKAPTPKPPPQGR